MTAPLNTSLLRLPDLALADHVGKLLVTATGDRLATITRIYNGMTAEAKARADFVRSWLYVEGGPSNEH